MLTMACGKRLDERRADASHEPGQAHQLDLARAQLVDERAVVVVARRPAAVIDDDRLDAGAAVRGRGRPAPATFEITTAIVASSRPSAMASMSACRLLPRPETSTPRRRRGTLRVAEAPADTELTPPESGRCSSPPARRRR